MSVPRGPVVCYHGSPGLPEEFTLLRRALPDRKIIAEPRRGYPNFKASAIPEGSLLLGYSWGCVDALKDAARFPEVRGVLLVAPYLFPKSRLGVLKGSLIRMPVIGNALLKKAGEKIISDMLEKSCSPQAVPTAYWEIAQRLSRPEILKPAALEKEIYAREVLQAAQEVGKKGLKVATVLGTLDRTADESEQMAPLRRHLNLKFEHRIENAGHAIIWTHVAELARTLNHFSEML